MIIKIIRKKKLRRQSSEKEKLKIIINKNINNNLKKSDINIIIF